MEYIKLPSEYIPTQRVVVILCKALTYICLSDYSACEAVEWLRDTLLRTMCNNNTSFCLPKLVQAIRHPFC